MSPSASCASARRAASSYEGRASSSRLSCPPAPDAMGSCAASQALKDRWSRCAAATAGVRRRSASAAAAACAATARTQVSALTSGGAPRLGAAAPGRDHPFAHLLGGPAREGQRQDALRRIDRREQPQIALREQRGLAAARPAPAPGPSRARCTPRARGVESLGGGLLMRPPDSSTLRASSARERGTTRADDTIGTRCEVGSTAARPAAKSAARRLDALATIARSASARLGMPSSLRRAPARLKIPPRSDSAMKAAFGRVDPAVGDGDQATRRMQQRIERQLRIVGPLAAPIGDPPRRSCSRSGPARRRQPIDAVDAHREFESCVPGHLAAFLQALDLERFARGSRARATVAGAHAGARVRARASARPGSRRAHSLSMARRCALIDEPRASIGLRHDRRQAARARAAPTRCAQAHRAPTRRARAR